MMMRDRRETAKIYQFPPRGVALAEAHRLRGLLDPNAPKYPTIEFGSSWYHEAAIQSAAQPPKP